MTTDSHTTNFGTTSSGTADEHLSAEEVAAYLDRGLAPAERDRAAAHLADCAGCRGRLVAQSRAEERGPEVVPSFPRSTRAWIPLLAAAGIGAILLGIGLWLAVGDGRRPGAVAERDPARRPSEIPPRETAGPLAPERESEAPSPDLAPPPGALDRAPRSEPRAEPPTPPAPVEELLALRGATRQIEGKTFRLEAGEWVDTAYRAEAHGPPADVRRGTAGHQALLAREPRIAGWGEAGPRVVVLVGATPYRILDAEAP